MVGLVVFLVIGASSKTPISAQIDELSILLCFHLPASSLGPLVLALAADRMSSLMEALARFRIWRVGLQSGVVRLWMVDGVIYKKCCQLVDALLSLCFLDLSLRCSDLPLSPLALFFLFGLRLGMGLHFLCCPSVSLPEGPVNLYFWAGHLGFLLSFISLTSLSSLWCFLSFPFAQRLPFDLGSPCRRQSSSPFCFGLGLLSACFQVPSCPLSLYCFNIL